MTGVRGGRHGQRNRHPVQHLADRGDAMVEHIVELVEAKAEEMKAATEAEKLAAE